MERSARRRWKSDEWQVLVVLWWMNYRKYVDECNTWTDEVNGNEEEILKHKYYCRMYMYMAYRSHSRMCKNTHHDHEHQSKRMKWKILNTVWHPTEHNYPLCATICACNFHTTWELICPDLPCYAMSNLTMYVSDRVLLPCHLYLSKCTSTLTPLLGQTACCIQYSIDKQTENARC